LSFFSSPHTKQKKTQAKSLNRVSPIPFLETIFQNIFVGLDCQLLNDTSCRTIPGIVQFLQSPWLNEAANAAEKAINSV
jgi:hypothetical protein